MAPSRPDDARSVASDPRAPEAERLEARAELERPYMPSGRDLIPADLVKQAAREAAALAEADAFMKAQARSRVVPLFGSGDPDGPKGAGNRAPGMRAVRFDRMAGLTAGDDYVEKTGALDFEGLRRMVRGTPVLTAIHNTRIKQMMRFCSPSEDGGPGFEIRHVDKDHEVTDAEKARMQAVSRFIQNCGDEDDPRERARLGRDTFRQFMARRLGDSLTFDAAPIETEMTRNGRAMSGFYAVDGASVRLCDEPGYRGDDAVFAVQLVAGRVATLFDRTQLVYQVRNPRTDIDVCGYGMGEAELLIRTVTQLLNAQTYNADFFDKNSIPKGVLQIFGEHDADDQAGLRRMWAQQVSGAGGHWGMPILFAKDKAEGGALWTPFNSAASEMAFAKWIAFLVSVCCAIYNIDPSEIGFEGFNAEKSSLSGSDTKQKMSASIDKGFRPLASHFEAEASDFIVATFEPSFVLRFVGLEEEDKARVWEAAKIVSTLDEMRAAEGLPPHPDPRMGALPVNPALIPAALQLAGLGPAGGDFGAQPAPEDPTAPGGGQGGDFGAQPLPGDPLAPGGGQGDDFGARPEPAEEEDPRARGAEFGAAPAPPPKPGNDFGKALNASAAAFWKVRGPTEAVPPAPRAAPRIPDTGPARAAPTHP